MVRETAEDFQEKRIARHPALAAATLAASLLRCTHEATTIVAALGAVARS